MSRWQKDEVDLWCEQWGQQRRKILGLTDLLPAERLGRLSCTLGKIKTEREGASQGTIHQSFPEVYLGDALLVNRAWKRMNQDWALVIEKHYATNLDIDGRVLKTKTRAAQLGIEVALYWKYWTFGKNYIHGFVTLSIDLETNGYAKSVSTQNTRQFA